MKDLFSKKGNDKNGRDTDSEVAITIIEKEADLFGDLYPNQLKIMIIKNRKFFRVSAELSINSN